ncbi:hypothetical protein DEI86_11945 [Curtobacterium sp. MCBD17_028]|nr:hypothetical protein DEI86_11945 [Curtobacterium sp. MCBD17_028]
MVAAAAACTAVVLGGPLLTVTSAAAATSTATTSTSATTTTNTAGTAATASASATAAVPATPSASASASPSAAATAGATASASATAPASADGSATGEGDPSLAEMNAAGNHTMGSTIAANTGANVSGGLMHANAANSSAVPGTDGFDISAWQTNSSINWSSAYNKGARFVYIKASESTSYTSSQFASQWTSATNAGLIRGAYHFAVPNKSSGATQATYFAAHGGGWSADGRTLPPLLDIEYDPYTGTDGTNTCYGLSASAMVSWIRDFSNTIKAKTGVLPAIYSTTDWWKTCTGNSAAFSGSPLFIARYPSSLSSGAGTLPASWTKYAMWQYADAGVFAGDQDVYNGTLAQLRQFATGGGGSAPAIPAVTTVGSSLSAGAQLNSGQGITSANKQYTLNMQADGNLVVYGMNRALWSSGTSGKPGAYLKMQADGNLVVYLGSKAIWESHTSNKPANKLTMEDNGDLRLENGSTLYWHTGRNGRDTMTPTSTLTAGQYLLSQNGKKQFIVQADGNVVVYSSGKATWASQTSKKGGTTLTLQADQNTVLYNSAGSALWSTKSSKSGATRLVMQDDGNLVLYKGTKAVWESHTSGR